MTTVNVHEAKTNLSRLLAQVEGSDHCNGMARLVSCKPKGKPQFGALKGQREIDDSFFDPLPEDELRLWEG